MTNPDRPPSRSPEAMRAANRILDKIEPIARTGRLTSDELALLIDAEFRELRKRCDGLFAALEKVSGDVNWMLNNRQFLNPDTFEYLDAPLTSAKGET